MAKVPRKRKKDPFDRSIDGIFGKFKTKDSYGLYYLMATVQIEDLDDLEAATDALPFEHIDFDELVQRDVDYERVDNEIIKDYLEQGSNRVVFFPPLLVAPLIIEDGKPAEKYDGFEDKVPEEPSDDNEVVYTAVWGKNKFKLELPLQVDDTGYSIHCQNNDKHYNYLNYAATLKYNHHAVKLVVIDGQHRLVALKRILDRSQQDLIADIELPICIFFPPNPIENTGSNDESLIHDMRELFITINTTAKEVSGHFTILLNDKSLSALCVRDLADYWKKKSLPHGQSYLHMLEWNERSSKKARQRNRKYSITTIAAIADCLGGYIFDKKNGGLAGILLNLLEVKEKLEEAGEISYGAINEEEFTNAQAKILKEQARNYVTPSLNILFSTPSPYNELEKMFSNRVNWLNIQVENNIKGAKQFRDDVLYKFRICQKHDQDSVKDIERDFEEEINIHDDDSVYFLNVFQQGLLRAWALISNDMATGYNLEPQITAKALIAGLEKLCFSTTSLFFDSKRIYTQRVLYRGASIIVNQTSRKQIVNLILSTFLHDETRNEFVNHLSETSTINKNSLNDYLYVLGKNAANNYLDSFYSTNRSWLKKEFRYVVDDASTVNHIAQLKEKSPKEFEAKIDELTTEKYNKSKEVLTNLLKIKSDMLSL